MASLPHPNLFDNEALLADNAISAGPHRKAMGTRKLPEQAGPSLWPLHLLHAAVCLATLAATFAGAWQMGHQRGALQFASVESSAGDWEVVSRWWMPDRDFDPANGQHTELSDAAWDTMHSRYVGIPDAVQHGYPPSALAPEHGNVSAYAVSAFHQLHCLRTIRSAWFAVLERGPSVLEDPTGVPGHPSTKKLLGPHITHCFDFIRQALMCFADPTLEPFLMEDGVTLQPRGSSGWGVTHQCRDFNALVDWSQERAIFQGL
ncbi:hypothetical protein BKCO1_25000117 [Neofusicoccum parvum]|nr:hypothetical protein BKCO1_25000117 [Neofusicoccum parvum]